MQPLMFFFGGFSSISLTMGFMCHEVAVNDSVQERLYREVAETEQQLNGQPLSYEALAKLKYLEAVLNETLRVWPIAGATDRLVTKPYVIEKYDGTKVQLNVGDGVWIPLDAIARDTNYFTDPDRFDPNRFTDDNKDNMPSTNVFLPFGNGPRNCVASRFALMECKAVMYYMVLNFHLEKCVKTQHPMKLSMKSAFLEPEKGFWLKLRPRKMA